MPTYFYKCPDCGTTQEIKHSIKENPEIKCFVCKKAMKRLILGGSGVIFRGKGFYCVENRKGGENEKKHL